jgi:hypothetical protein
MKIIFSILILLFFNSCNSVDSNSNDRFSIQTENVFYKLDTTQSILTTFTNNLGMEVKIYNSSCGGPYFIIERYDGKNWSLFAEHPICERLPATPVKLINGRNVSLCVNISLMHNIVAGVFRMKFEIKRSTDNITIEDQFLYSNQFSFVQ